MSARQQNQTAMEKVSSSDFSSGATLSPEQFEDFMGQVRNRSEVLGRANFIPVEAESGDIPQVSVGSRLLRSVGEGNSTSLNSVNSGDVSYNTSKVSLPWEQTWEASNQIISNPEEKVRELFINQFRNDLEILGSVGDTTSGDNFESIEDGWLKRADDKLSGSNQYDHGAAGVNDVLFNELETKMPHRFREQQTPVFITSHAQKTAYKKFLSDRSTAAGDQMMLTGEEPTPYGYEIVTPLGWPDDRVVFTSMENLLYVVQDDVRVKSTADAKENVLNDVERIYNLLAKVDYEIGEAEGMTTASNVAAP